MIKSGATFASSPKRINIHALDPAIIATSLSLLDRNKNVDLIGLLSKTKYGKDGVGGLMSKGTMYTGYPRSEAWILKSKEYVRSLINRNALFKVNIGRNKCEKFEGVVIKMYNNVFTV